MSSGPWDDEATVVGPVPEWSAEEPGAQGAQHSPEAVARPALEVETRTINGPAALASVRRAYEIWTKNRVYILDSSLRCIEVIDLTTGVTNPQHPFLGARCAGGRDLTLGELSFPFPAPGSEAVFHKTDGVGARVKLSVTSAVVRVILHASRVRVPKEQADRVWSKISTWG